MVQFLSFWTFDFPEHESKLRFNLLCIQAQIFKHLICKNKDACLHMRPRFVTPVCAYQLENNFSPWPTFAQDGNAQDKGPFSVVCSLCPERSSVPRCQQGQRCLGRTQGCRWQGMEGSTGSNRWAHPPRRSVKAREEADRVRKVDTVLCHRDDREGAAIWRASRTEFRKDKTILPASLLYRIHKTNFSTGKSIDLVKKKPQTTQQKPWNPNSFHKVSAFF